MKTLHTALILTTLFISTNAFALPYDGAGNPPTSAESATHDCIAIVIDGSGSMKDAISPGSNDRKITVAKNALKSVIDQIPQTTHVGVLLFVGDDWGRKITIDWLAPIAPMNKDQIKAAIDQINPGGGTPLGTSIKKAADALIEARSAQHNRGTYQLLVVTDGVATPAEEDQLMKAYAPEVMSSGIQLDVIGVGMEERHPLATIARRYWKANDAIALDRALKTAVQVETTNAAAAQVDYDLLKGVPDDVANAWLKEVTNMDLRYWPIGVSKEEYDAAKKAAEQKNAPAGQNAAPNGNAPTDQAAPADQNQGKEKGCSASPTGINPVPTGLIALCLVSFLTVRRRQMVRVQN
ncbi:MAG: VWA domain-containing protein [Candidatus Uhrbacteria bacterium]|nr:VWA domain-containing protein [Candidatus Uhrbacteria bacterium]